MNSYKLLHKGTVTKVKIKLDMNSAAHGLKKKKKQKQTPHKKPQKNNKKHTTSFYGSSCLGTAWPQDDCNLPISLREAYIIILKACLALSFQ